MSITFDALQRTFEQAWHEEKKLPVSLTIAEADYEAFAESTIPVHIWSEFERDLLGDARIAELDLSNNRMGISHIVNYVNNGVVKLIRSAEQPQGDVHIEYVAWVPFSDEVREQTGISGYIESPELLTSDQVDAVKLAFIALGEGK